MRNSLKHVNDLFVDKYHQITKSHCFICHKKINVIDKEHRGNACIECEARANKVARNILTEHESDLLLRYQMRDLEEEVWNIDGIDYRKFPNGDLIKHE